MITTVHQRDLRRARDRKRRHKYVASRIGTSTWVLEGIWQVGQVYSVVFLLNEHRLCLMHINDLLKKSSRTVSDIAVRK
jgi:DNA-binding transcriptional regulator GbsR (MarR family)